MKYVYKNSLSLFNGKNIPEGFVEISDDTYEKLLTKEYIWENDKIIVNPNYNEIVAKRKEQLIIQSKKKEMKEILAWLNANDYIINKHTLGEYTDENPKWIAYLEERAIKLAKYNMLEEQIKSA